jgi:hypothetical protein
MANVTLKWGGKAVLKVSGGEALVGTWEDQPRNPGYGYVFRGRTNQGKQSEWMKKSELREWFETQSLLPPPTEQEIE